jgi:hypothetical protein
LRQTWHIFLKDARRLRYETAVILALTAAYAWLQGHWSPISTAQTVRLNQTANIVRVFLLPMGWWYLASLAVYGEPISGDRQFWVTRPYRWTSLLGAKLLFLIAFVSFPLLLADCFIVTRQGFEPWTNPGGLLWHEVAIFASILLPMIAAASITTSLARVAVLGLATIIPIIALQRILSPYLDTWFQFGVSEGWIEILMIELVLLSAALAIVILQYRARRTKVSCIVFACAAAVTVLLGGGILPRSTSWALQWRFFRPHIDTSSITASFSPEVGKPPRPRVAPEGTVCVSLPIRFDGAAPRTTVVADVILADLTLPNGKPLKKWLWIGGSPPYSNWQFAFIECGLFERLKGTPVRMHLKVYMTVLGDSHTEEVPLSGGPYRISGFGLCQSVPRWDRWTTLTCWSPFRPPAYAVARFAHADKIVFWKEKMVTYSPLPAELGINPISGNVWAAPEGATILTVTTMHPLAHIRREIDIPNVQLADFAN